MALFQLKNSCLSPLLLFTTFMSLYSSTSAKTSGTATYYTPPYVPSACNGYKDDGVMIAALSEKLFKGGASCGQHYQVSCVSGTNAGVPHPCTGNSVTVKVVDKCPDPSCRGTIDLSQEAFATIADTAAGKINIVYQQV